MAEYSSQTRFLKLLDSCLILDKPTVALLKANLGKFSEGMIQDLITVLQKTDDEMKRMIEIGLKNDTNNEYLNKLKTIIAQTAKVASEQDEKMQSADPESYLNQQLKDL